MLRRLWVMEGRFSIFDVLARLLFRSAYVDEHVEARYEEIINHLHKALSSTEQDEQDFKVCVPC